MTAKGERPNRRRLKAASGALSHVQTREALTKVWSDIAKDLYSPRVCKGNPRWFQTLARSFWDADPSQVVSAVTGGDPAFFVSYQIRLDQMDCELVRAERGLAQRSPVIRARYILDGFQSAAADVLREMGGEWPPTSPVTESEPS